MVASAAGKCCNLPRALGPCEIQYLLCQQCFNSHPHCANGGVLNTLNVGQHYAPLLPLCSLPPLVVHDFKVEDLQYMLLLLVTNHHLVTWSVHRLVCTVLLWYVYLMHLLTHTNRFSNSLWLSSTLWCCKMAKKMYSSSERVRMMVVLQVVLCRWM